MTDEKPATAADNQPIKSATDLKLEALEKSISELQARYEKELSEALQANKELWAQLHPAQPAEPPAAAVPEAPPADEAADAMFAALGIKEKKE